MKGVIKNWVIHKWPWLITGFIEPKEGHKKFQQPDRQAVKEKSWPA